MRRTTMSLACLFASVFLVASATAQMPTPKPAPELSKLDYLAGDWVTDGDLKPSPMGPGGKMSSTDHAEWMEGKFFPSPELEIQRSNGRRDGYGRDGLRPGEEGLHL